MEKTEQLFSLSPAEAVQQQKKLRAQVRIEPIEQPVRTVAGADISFDRGSDIMHAGLIVFSYPELEEVSRALASVKTEFPYIPGLLAYREIPALLKVWNLLTTKPDVLIMDGHGIAHPRRMGIATHFGIVTGQPTIGCAKKILAGTHKSPGQQKGDYTYIWHRKEKVGMALRSRNNVKPIFISPGHLVSFEDTYKIVMQCLTNYKLPKTTRKTHQMVNKLRRGEIDSGYSESGNKL